VRGEGPGVSRVWGEGWGVWGEGWWVRGEGCGVRIVRVSGLGGTVDDRSSSTLEASRRDVVLRSGVRDQRLGIGD